MSEQARIDALQFAREGRDLHGELAVTELPRLEDVVYERAGTVAYALQGSVDRRGKPVIEARIGGTLSLVCQRCLGRMDYELQRSSRFVLIEGSQTLPDVSDEDPSTENIRAEEMCDVADIVEQEVLLGLPLAPVHPEGLCEATPELPRDENRSPFAELAKLKKR